MFQQVSPQEVLGNRPFQKYGPTPASFSFIFGLFKKTIEFLQQIDVKSCHVHPVNSTGIQTHELRNH